MTCNHCSIPATSHDLKALNQGEPGNLLLEVTGKSTICGRNIVHTYHVYIYIYVDLYDIYLYILIFLLVASLYGIQVSLFQPPKPSLQGLRLWTSFRSLRSRYVKLKCWELVRTFSNLGSKGSFHFWQSWPWALADGRF